MCKFTDLPGWQTANHFNKPSTWVYKVSFVLAIPRCFHKCSSSAAINDIGINTVFLVIHCSLYITFNYLRNFHHLLHPITTLFLSSSFDCEGSASHRIVPPHTQDKFY